MRLVLSAIAATGCMVLVGAAVHFPSAESSPGKPHAATRVLAPAPAKRGAARERLRATRAQPSLRKGSPIAPAATPVPDSDQADRRPAPAYRPPPPRPAPPESPSSGNAPPAAPTPRPPPPPVVVVPPVAPGPVLPLLDQLSSPVLQVIPSLPVTPPAVAPAPTG